MRQLNSIKETTIISYNGTEAIVGRYCFVKPRDELEKILAKHCELFSCSDCSVGEYQYEETNGEDYKQTFGLEFEKNQKCEVNDFRVLKNDSRIIIFLHIIRECYHKKSRCVVSEIVHWLTMDGNSKTKSLLLMNLEI